GQAPDNRHDRREPAPDFPRCALDRCDLFDRPLCQSKFARGFFAPRKHPIQKASCNMGKGNDLGLLDLLKGKGNSAEALAALAAKAPTHEPNDGTPAATDAKLNDVLNRIS